tara:strand:- start:9 stop:626 length:618 start_codon:yes stop_codon:yes gene_type:complete
MKRFIVYSLMSCLFAQIDYETEIQTIFNNNCISCHGNSGGLSLESYANLMTGGNSGTVIISGDHSNSLLWEKINNGQMPPNNQLPSSNIDLIAAWIDEGALEELNIKNNKALPERFTLHQNYPNPFNPVTNFDYDLPEDAMVNITVFDMMGKVVRTLVNDQQSAGYKTLQWNAMSNSGQPVSSGLYIYTIQAGEFSKTRKMILLK